jgi:Flp pilus assembly protein TadG
MIVSGRFAERKAGLLRAGPGRRATAAVEFGIVAPIFVLLLLGIADVGNIIRLNTMIQQALWNGGRWAMIYPSQTWLIQDTVAFFLPTLQASIQNGDDSWRSQIPVSLTCSCGQSDSDPNPAASACPIPANCPAPFVTVKISTSLTYKPLLPFTALPQPGGSYVIRLR